MRHVLIGPALLASALFLSVLPGAARADPPSIEATIRGQMQAFRAEDVAGGAFSFASDGIRRIFETPERFGAWCAMAIRWSGHRVRCS